MDDALDWVEGEFLALESLRQGRESWAFPRPPLPVGAAGTTSPSDANVRRIEAVGQEKTNEDAEEDEGSSPRPQARLFLD